ncbi:F-box protein At3g07870-like [Papaver somniferum]|uniref:F-box protein At3g07870-like n=1 Tax=Papaver somniferum TaxID=3469 RepID=UPI000E703295|nr:F-box protein At3g07870-like [Papaver somniferum]
MGNFDMLPENMMLEILSRVPTEYVLECKLVSKPWRDLVQLPSLSQMHLDHHLSDSSAGKLISFIFSCRESKIKEFYYSEYDESCQEAPFNRRTRINLGPPFENNSIIGSCNGLVCFSRRVRKTFREWDYGPAYICNPITREYIILSNFQGFYMWIGFGYSRLSNEYKVVRICESEGEDSNVGIVQVYTLGSGNGWRNAGTIDITMDQVCNGVFVNEALHWADEEGTVIFAFDLADENFSQLPPPPPCLRRPGVPCIDAELRVLGGFLSVTYYYDTDDTDDCDILLLKKNKDNNAFSWSKEFSLDNDTLLPLEFTKSGRFLGYRNSKIYSYDPKASSPKMDVSFGKCIYQAIHHKNTLVSLKVLGEMDTKAMESCDKEQ